jgi:glycosyltransferase involved in cell wall biosynthesis
MAQLSDRAEPATDLQPRGGLRIDVDFSLAIHNRTGKYFIGRDVLTVLGDDVGAVYYGSLVLDGPPSGLFGRALGRLQHWQVMGRTGQGGIRLPQRRRGPAPLLHLDPFTVPTTPLRPYDAVLCHDIGPLTHPELFDAPICAAYRAIYAEIANVGPHMIFVSQSSQDAFMEHFPSARPTSARVIYPALRIEIGDAAPTPVPGLAGPFLLTVGSIGARKNQARCIAAFDRSGLAAQGVRYVLCGGPEPGFDDVAERAAETPGVLLLPYVTDRELAWLYRHASGFVLASLLEGFGIPVAEAIARGLVPVVSRGGVLEEVAGPGALDVDPLDEAEIAAAMMQVSGMGREEQSRRRAELEASIERFRFEAFARGWSELPADMLATRAGFPG